MTDKRMAWLGKPHETKVLHIWDGDRGWIPYSQHPLKVPEYKSAPGNFGNESRGLSTMHRLLSQGYAIDVEANRDNLPTAESDLEEQPQTFT